MLPKTPIRVSDNSSEVQLPISSRVEILKILGTYGNFQAAADHVRELLEAEAHKLILLEMVWSCLEMVPTFLVIHNGLRLTRWYSTVAKREIH